MSPRQVSISKFLALVLRHAPEKIGITLDRNGWIEVDALLAACAAHGRKISRSELAEVVRQNDKQRFAFDESSQRIRANQGHSITVDLQLESCAPPQFLYHGTVARFLASIAQQGLRKGTRHHVHLSANREVASRVGARRGQPVILVVRAAEMAAAGHSFFRAANEVWLVDHVPPAFLILP